MPNPIREDRAVMEDYDVVIVGGGPSGLSCAIRLKQVNPDIKVVVLEKGSEVGAHLLSGAVFEPRTLNELIPDWKERGAPLRVEAKEDHFVILTNENSSFRFITPPQMHNKGNYIISLGELGRWLKGQAEELGVDIFEQVAVSEMLYDNDEVIGIATRDMGIGKNGEKTSHFEPGMEFHAKQVVLAEGCHGSLTKTVIAKYNLRANSDPQTYGLGVKEIWEIDPAKHKQGFIMHTLGWPMDLRTYGGSWMYHMENNQVSIGFVIGLDYTNPYLSPFNEMQRFKTHPKIRAYLEGGKRIAYGARALVEGGFQSLPKLTFPGGVLIGDTAGFLNVPKIKGNHTAMKSGMLAAEEIAKLLQSGAPSRECTGYTEAFKNSWIYKELYKVRNIRPGFRWGTLLGMAHAAFQTAGGWMLPYTLKNHADHAQLKEAKDCTPIDYPKPDGVLTFDRLTSVQYSNTNHEEDQPSHLKLKDPSIPIGVNLPKWAEPAQRYCPAAVYEVIEEAGAQKFVINAQNCVHCKTCDIKDPSQNINWTVPQGGGGPNYPNM